MPLKIGQVLHNRYRIDGLLPIQPGEVLRQDPARVSTGPEYALFAKRGFTEALHTRAAKQDEEILLISAADLRCRRRLSPFEEKEAPQFRRDARHPASRTQETGASTGRAAFGLLFPPIL